MADVVIRERVDEKGWIHRMEIPLKTFLREHDFEAVVRCKDCKYGEPNGRYGCTVYHFKRYETHEMSPTDFCSHAERRKDGTD